MNSEKKKDPRRRWNHRRRNRNGKKPEVATPETGLNEEVKKPETEVLPAEPEETGAELLSSPETLFLENPSAITQEEPEAEDSPKLLVVGVRFRPAGKNYSFDPNGLSLMVGDRVIVETSQGQEFGTVSTASRYVSQKELVLPLRKVLREASPKDLSRWEENKALELRARKIFLEKVSEHKLEMALSDVECSFDKSKLIFYFTSDGRVDFREFVKDMAGVFKTRIELRQIGVRDEAKQLGGLGICGRPLCCSSFLDDFQQVSIKMAKEQNLSLNPTKISGTCGRLMCCLRYENEVYVEASKHCPRADQAVMTPQGRGVVTEANILCGRCKVKLDSDPENIALFSASELKILPKTKKNPNPPKEGEANGEKSGQNQ